MATTPDQIDLWRASATEHERLEFKEAKNQYDYQKLQEYCVGLANSRRGGDRETSEVARARITKRVTVHGLRRTFNN